MNNDMKMVFDKYMSDKVRIREKIEKRVANNRVCLGKLLGPVIVVFVLFGGILGVNFWLYEPYSYVSIDINPSIVLTANRLERIIKVEGLNDDAKSLLNDIKFKNMKVNVFNDLILEKAIERGFIDKNGDSNAILVTVYCNDEQKRWEMQQNINSHLHNCLDGKGINSLIIDQALTKEDIDNANLYGVSQGKILYVKKAILENPDLKFEDLINLPIREIAKYIDGYEEIKDNIEEHNHKNQENCKND